MTDQRGWFADLDQDDPDFGWQPCLETGTGHIPSFQVWFKSQEACEEYIRDFIIPVAGRMSEDPT